MNANFSGYVLAGGKSSRMKTDKAFLKFGGETFLERAVKALETVCGERIKVVLNSDQKKLPEFSCIFDVFENRGALGGIHAALKDCRTELAIILACDMPFVTSDAIEKLAKTALESKDFSAIVPRQTDGRLQPLCAVYRTRKCLNDLEKFLSENPSGAAREFLAAIDAKYVDSTDEQLFFNVNQPADYDAIVNFYQSGV